MEDRFHNEVHYKGYDRVSQKVWSFLTQIVDVEIEPLRIASGESQTIRHKNTLWIKDFW